MTRTKLPASLFLSLVATIASGSGCDFLSVSGSGPGSPGFGVPAVFPPQLTLTFPSSSPGYSGKPIVFANGLDTNPGSQLLIYGDGNCTTLINAVDTTGIFQGNVEFILSTPGVYAFSAKASDGGGAGTSSCSTSNPVYQFLGPTAPSSIVLSSPALSPGYTSMPQFFLSGLIGVGSVNLYADSGCTVGIGTGVVSASTGYATASALTLGAHTFYAQAVDDVGLSSPCSTANISYTYSPPPVPSSLGLASPTQPSDYNPSPTIVVGGIPSSATVKIYKDSRCSSLVGTGVGVSPLSVSLSPPLTPGSYNFYAESAASDGSSACSTATVAYTLLPPPVPSGLSLVSPGSSPNSSPEIEILISGLANGVYVYLFSDAACTQQVAYGYSGGTTSNLYVYNLAVGSYTYYAYTKESSGGPSACSTATLAYTVTGPPAPTTLAVSSPGTNAIPSVTLGGLTVGLTVHLYTDSGCTNQVASSSIYAVSQSISPSSQLALGTYTFYATQSNGASTSACSTASATYVLNPLASPSTIVLVTPASSPSFLQTPTVAVSTVLAGQTVNLFTDAACAQRVGSAYYSGSTTIVTVSSILSAGANTLYANLTDYSNGHSLCSTVDLPYTVTARMTLSAYQTYQTGSDLPTQTAFGDFNGDGKADMVVANSQASYVSYFKGNGDGTFQVQAEIPMPDYNSMIAVGDFNGDGKLDYVTGDFASSRVIVVLGNGNGTFGTGTFYSSDSLDEYAWVKGLAVADFNGDGKPDIAVANGTGGSEIGVLFGNGDGTFQAPVMYPTSSGPSYIVAADVNGDGHPDLVVAAGGVISVYLNEGNGVFESNVDYAAASNDEVGVAAGDLTGSGHLDLVSADGDNSSFTVFMNNGNGTFGSGTTVTVPGSGNITSVAIADMDGDSKQDVIVTDYTNNRVTVFFGNGDGTFSLPEDFATSNHPSCVSTGVFTGSGKNSLAVVTDPYSTGTVSVLWQ